MLFPDSLVTPGHPDWELLSKIAHSLDHLAGGREALVKRTGVLLRRAADEVIDSARTGRLTLAETEKTEKTYLGTKVEILFRSMLGLSRGSILDLMIDSEEVDVKNSMGVSWMIPHEAVDRPCVLINSDETSARFNLGLIRCRNLYLTAGGNQDLKRQISASGRCNILWLAQHDTYPENIWELIGRVDRSRIMAAEGGTDRVAALFRTLQGRPIHRDVVATVARQKDPMKRIRRNGGARDQLDVEGVAVLWGARHREVAEQLGLPGLTKHEFMSYRPRNKADRALLVTWDLLPA